MRLIDADALKNYVDIQKNRQFIGCTIGEAMKIMVDEQPTIEPERNCEGCRFTFCKELAEAMEDDLR